MLAFGPQRVSVVQPPAPESAPAPALVAAQTAGNDAELEEAQKRFEAAEKKLAESKKKVALIDQNLSGFDGIRKGSVLAAIKEFRAKEKDYLLHVSRLNSVSEARDTARRSFEGLRKARLDSFMAGYSAITLKLKEMYQMITLGGDAELELVDSLDPFSEGIVFSVRPPKKSWKNIANLSGGE